MGYRILIVEDEVLVCLELIDLLTDAGFDVVGPVHTLRAGRDIACSHELDGAILDVNLGRETSEEIGVHLRRRHIPFIVMSALKTCDLPAIYARAPRSGKPLRPAHLIGLLTAMAVPRPS